MEDSPKLTDQIRALVTEHCGVALANVHLTSRLEEDFGLTGDDAEEFLRLYAKQFSVDMSTLNFHQHFGPEGCNPLWWFYRPDWLEDLGNYPVTVGHLINVAQVGRWYSPPCVKPNSPPNRRVD